MCGNNCFINCGRRLADDERCFFLSEGSKKEDKDLRKMRKRGATYLGGAIRKAFNE